ncbi:hypothetical protein L873DRAFT_1688967 [Choiromyces venosus 120613-1]|uniref:RhoGAP-domain-containing protein n=1 Tax=Choiromyces venosus 120613-1 TaxID=1336337 RepID=A0A3N4JWC3_9PEZI|nr:hypothetical protein L873DRAFT_1688967 [Choiromyces venosus 120613-1]
MSHLPLHTPPTPPHFGLSGRDFSERSTQDRLRVTESSSTSSLNNHYAGGNNTTSTLSHSNIHPPSPNVHALQVNSQGEARTVYTHQGYPSSPRRPQPPSQHHQRDNLTTLQDFDCEINAGNSNSGNNSGGGLIVHQQVSFTHSQKSPYLPSSPYHHNHYSLQSNTPSRTQDQLERLQPEASSVTGGFSGPLGNDPSHRHDSGSISPYSISKSLSGDSSNSVHGTSRDRGHSLPPVPETSSSAATTPAASPSMSSASFQRSIPRTSSIDSAISSVSAQSGANHTNRDGTHSSAKDVNPTPAEIQSLIQTAGSAESLIAYMMKEKASAASQNAQLWKLVDKQRAMIYGLNKDLERALKDKERYRKALKEQRSQIPPLPSSSMGPSRTSNESPAPSESAAGDSPQDGQPKPNPLVRSESMPLPERTRSDSSSVPGGSMAPYPLTPPLGQEMDGPANSLGDRSPSPTNHGPRGPNGQSTPDSVTSSLGRKHSDQSLRGQGNLQSGNSLPPMMESAEEGPAPLTKPDNVYPAPGTGPVKGPIPLRMKLGISTAVAPASGLGKSPLRKAPPAPLSLGLHTESKLHDDTDEDDNVSIDEIVGYQQLSSQKSTEPEGKSSDSDSEKSWQHTPVDKKAPSGFSSPEIEVHKSVSPARPTPSPRSREKHVSSPSTQHKHNEGLLPPTTVGFGKEQSAVSPGIRRQFARAPLPSPGLPSSPRPIDRPLGSPMPRIKSPGLPTSPRMSMTPVPYGPGVSRMNMPLSASMPPRSPDYKGHGKNASAGSLSSAGGSMKPASLDGLSSLLILPSAIPSVDSRVVSSRMKPARASMMPGSKPRPLSEDSVFTLGVFSRASGKELLRVEKDVGALPALDSRLRNYITYSVKVPDRNLFSGHAPAKIDARRNAIDEYFAGVLGATMDERAALALCEFFSTDVVDNSVGRDSAPIFKDGSGITGMNQDGKPVKEGYLTKRGKNFGGWKARYFVLNGPVLKYYESPGESQLGQIKLQSAQIGRQSQNQKVKETAEGANDADNQYRHAFLVLEPKRKDSSTLVRHVLCAENDAERDEWVDALMQYVDKGGLDDDANSTMSQVSQTSATGREGKKKQRHGSKHKDSKEKNGDESLQALSYEATAPGAAPARGPTPEDQQQAQAMENRPIVGPVPDRGPVASKQISGPTNGSVISDLAAWGSKFSTPASHAEQKSTKKRSIWGFRQRSSSDLTNQPQQVYERIPVSRSVFGASLEEAVHLSKPMGVDVHLPAVVYRCIQYLDAKNAASEEGIFRLSGSNVVIKGLRERFNTESDYNLLDNDEYYDVHAVAGLLKLYLRELPTNVLTTERREDFVKVTEMDDKTAKIAALNELVHTLPIENFELLRVLSGHLIHIVENSDINKMTIRNAVGIVFSPTLNIPAQVFSMFLHEYNHIFVRPEEGNLEALRNHYPQHPHQNPPLTPSPISPRNPYPTPTDRRPSTAGSLLNPNNIGAGPLTPAMHSPLPPLRSAPQEPPIAPKPQFVSYEPAYETVVTPTPTTQPVMGFPAPPPMLGDGTGDNGPSAVKARRRESSMMFMMGRKGYNRGANNGGSTLVMEDSVYE